MKFLLGTLAAAMIAGVTLVPSAQARDYNNGYGYRHNGYGYHHDRYGDRGNGYGRHYYGGRAERPYWWGRY